jgi:diguanylate cyclase (GGDEF)-like protein
LVADDNPIAVSLLRKLLVKWGYEVIVAVTGGEALACLESEDAPHMAILDWMMPGMEGVEICRRVRAGPRERYTYILLLTCKDDSQDLVLGLEAGADDYVAKPFRNHELRARLRAGQRIVSLQDQLHAARESLERQAHYDGLTGLWNRSAIFGILQKELSRASRGGTPVAVVMVDVDRFKEINDTYGHRAGDEVLRQAAQRMSGLLRCYDAIGRYGGEEFLMVLPGCDGDGALAQAERVREAIAAREFEAAGGSIGVTCSLGIAWTDQPHPCQVDSLVVRADEELYLAKHRGRNRTSAGPVVRLPGAPAAAEMFSELRQPA